MNDDDRADLARRLEHSALRPDQRREDVERTCAEARALSVRAVCVPSSAVALARELVDGSGLLVVAVAGFPHGTASVVAKAAEARQAVRDGADEVDYVIHVGTALEGLWHELTDEARAIVGAADGRAVKAILETGCLDAETQVASARAVVDGGAAFVKTCTGFGPGAATPETVRRLRGAVGDHARIKASGGVRDAESARRLVEAGADTIGTSRAPRLLQDA